MPHCNQCEQDWEQRKLGGDPVQCPRCHRTDWRELKKGNRGSRDAGVGSGNIGSRALCASVRGRVGVASGPNTQREVPPKDARVIEAPGKTGVGNALEISGDKEPLTCPYTEYDPETGETYGCLLAEHSLKIKHRRGPAI
jgi:hypothetical protein